MIFTELDGKPRMMQFDFKSGQYVDMLSKSSFDEGLWETLAQHQARTGILSQKFNVKDCRLLTQTPLHGMGKKSKSREKLSLG